jgi:hypothetical protein
MSTHREHVTVRPCRTARKERRENYIHGEEIEGGVGSEFFSSKATGPGQLDDALVERHLDQHRHLLGLRADAAPTPHNT